MYCQRFVLTYLQHDTEGACGPAAWPFRRLPGRRGDYLAGTPSSPVTYCARPKPNDQSPAVFSTYPMKTSSPATPSADSRSAMAANRDCLAGWLRPAWVKIWIITTSRV